MPGNQQSDAPVRLTGVLADRLTKRAEALGELAEDQPPSRNIELSIAKKFVDMHGGRV